MAVTIAGTATNLNIHARQYNKDVQQVLRQGLEWEQMMSVRATDKVYVAPNVSTTNVIQPYQWQFTPTGAPTFDEVSNTLQPIKVDILITAEDLEKFWDAWAVEWMEVGMDPVEWSFPRYLYEMVYLPKILEEMNTNAWSGTYAAPTPGTAGLSINSVDGYAKKIADAITASSLTEYPTGALVAGTMVTQLETWIESMPIPYRDAPGNIYCSPTIAKQYYRNYRATFGSAVGTANNENRELLIEMTNKKIVPINAMEGSSRLIFFPTQTNNMIWGTRRGFPTYPVIRWEPYERSIKGMAEFYRFYGFEYWDHLIVNDQA